MILSCQNLSKSFGSDDIIKNVSFQINEGDKVAIVGNNGAGKSTLLKMITGELDTDAGTVVFAKDTTIGYLAQYQTLTQLDDVDNIKKDSQVDEVTGATVSSNGIYGCVKYALAAYEEMGGLK